jgi:hypothetical protein
VIHFVIIIGTMFRLPLRSSEISKQSKICNQFLSDQNIGSLLQDCISEANSLLLFLRFVKHLDIYEKAEKGMNVVHKIT